MKKHTKRGRLVLNSLLFFTLFAVFSSIFSCVNPALTQGPGSLSVTVVQPGSEPRSIRPETLNLETVDKWQLILSAEGQDTLTSAIVIDVATLQISDIPPGTWSITLNALDESSAIIGQAKQDITISSGSNSANLTVYPLQTETGNGALSITFNFTDFLVNPGNSFVSMLPVGSSDPETDAVTLQITRTSDLETQSSTFTVTSSVISSGDYILHAYVTFNDKQYVLVNDPLVKIFDNRTTSHMDSFSLNDWTRSLNIRYVSAAAEAGKTGLTTLSPMRWSDAIAWANNSVTATKENPSTIVLMDDITLSGMVTVTKPLSIRSVYSSYSSGTPCKLSLSTPLADTGFIRVITGTFSDATQTSITGTGSLWLERIELTVFNGVSVARGLIEFVGTETGPANNESVVHLQSGTKVLGNLGTYAGGIYAEANMGNVILDSGSGVTGNHSWRGGAVSVLNGCRLTVKGGANVNGNVADHLAPDGLSGPSVGGAFYVDANSTLVLEDSTDTTIVSGNSATGYGAGLFIEVALDSAATPQIYTSASGTEILLAKSAASSFFSSNGSVNNPLDALCVAYPVSTIEAFTAAIIADWPAYIQYTGASDLMATGTTTIAKPVAISASLAGIQAKDASILFSITTGGFFILDTVTLKGNNSASAQIVSVNSGTLEMRDNALISGNYISSDNMENIGGAVYVSTGGSFIMKGGTINGCSANKGGAIAAIGSESTPVTVDIQDGNIMSCSAVYGGAIYAGAYSTVTLGGGAAAVIKENTSVISTTEPTSGGGGGIYIASDATVTMQDSASVTQNNSSIGEPDPVASLPPTTMGAGVYVAAKGTFNLNGGSITDNIGFTDYGVGMYAEPDSIVSVAGEIDLSTAISGNAKHETIEATSAPVTVPAWQQPFLQAALVIPLDSSELQPEGVLRAALVGPSGGNVYPLVVEMGYFESIPITSSLTVSSPVWIMAQSTCSFARGESFIESMFTVSGAQAHLALDLNIALDGTGDGVTAPLITASDSAKLTIKGAYLQNNPAGGISLDNATLNLLSGAIQYNNKASGNGGGVFAENGSVVLLSGGSINTNSALQGGGLYLADTSSIQLDTEATLAIESNDATASEGYGGIFAVTNNATWVPAVFSFLSDFVINNTPINHNLVDPIQ